jgi:hypothetical protein
MKSHKYYNDLLEELFNDCKIQYGNIYNEDKTIDIKYFITYYVLQNNYRANELINILSNNSREKKEDLKEGLIDILTDELNKYKESLDNRMDISGGSGGRGGRGGSSRYKKSSKSKSKKNI